MPKQERPPTRVELLDHIDSMDLVFAGFVQLWQDHLPADIRADIQTKFYEPNLRILIRARRRPYPR